MIFTLAEIQQRLGCGEKKASQILKHLRTTGLIQAERPKRDGPYHIRVLPFEPQKGRFPNRQNDRCADVENAVRDLSKVRHNKTDINNTDRNKTHTIRLDCEREIKKEIYSFFINHHEHRQSEFVGCTADLHRSDIKSYELL